MSPLKDILLLQNTFDKKQAKLLTTHQAGMYLLKTNDGNTRTKCEICSKSTKRHQNDVNEGVLVSLHIAL